MSQSPTRLRVWLERCKTGVQVVLVYAGLEDTVVDRWSRDQIPDDSYEHLAHDILNAAQEHCNDLQARCSYRIQWRGEADNVLSTKPLRMEPDYDASHRDARPEGSVEVEDGTPAGLLAQLMRHKEVEARMHHSAMAQILRAYGESMESLRRELQELRKENLSLRRKQRDDEGDSAESEARERAWTTVAEAVPQLLPHVAEAFQRRQQQQQQTPPNGGTQ